MEFVICHTLNVFLQVLPIITLHTLCERLNVHLKVYGLLSCAIAEEEIEEQIRQLQAEEAAMQLGIFNQYAKTYV